MEAEVEIQEQFQEPQQQQPDPPRKKLWNLMRKKELYTKSYEDFDKQFSTPEQIDKLHNYLTGKQIYTKPTQEFKTQFFADREPATPKKKVGTIGFEESSLQAGNVLSQSGGVDGEEIPTIEMYTTPSGEMVEAEPVALSKKYRELSNRKKEGDVIVGSGLTMGTTGTPVPDEEAQKSAKKLKEDFPNIDFEGISEEIKDIPDEVLQRVGKELMADREQNNPLYQRKLANIKWRKGLEDNLLEQVDKGNIDPDNYNRIKESIDNLPVFTGTGDFSNQRGAIQSLAQDIQLYGGENKQQILQDFAVEVSKVYGSAYANNFDKYAADTPESKYLNNDELLALQYLKDIAPEQAGQYDRLMVDQKLIKDDPDALKGYNRLKQTLEETGIGLQLNSVKEELNELNRRADKNGTLSEEDINKSVTLEKKYGELTQKLNELDKKYPERIEDKVDDAMQEILGQKIGGLNYFGGTAFRAIKNTGQGIWEAVSTPFMSDQSNTLRELSIMGEGLDGNRIYHKTDKNTAILTDTMAIEPELQAQIDIITNNKVMSESEKEIKLYRLLKDNTDKFSRVYVKGGKFNINPSSIMYGLSDLTTTLLPFIALETVTGGGATAGLARKFVSTFTAAAATTFHAEYESALLNGLSQSDAYKEAMGMTAISSLAMAGAATPQKIKALVNPKTSSGKLILSMSDDAIQKVLNKGTPKAFSAIKQTIKDRAKATPAMLGQGAKAGAEFEVAMTAANELKHQIYDTEIDREANFKNSLLMIGNFSGLGLMGHIKYKSPTEMQKGAGLLFGEKPDSYISVAEQMKKDGLLNEQQFEQRKDLITQFGEAYKTLPKNLTEKAKADYLYQTVIKNEANKGKSDLPPKQAAEAEKTALVADHTRGLILEPPTEKQLNDRIGVLERKLEPKKDADGKAIEIPEKEKLDYQAELEALKNESETRKSFEKVEMNRKEFVDTKLSEPVEGLDEQGIPIGKDVPPPTEQSGKDVVKREALQGTVTIPIKVDGKDMDVKYVDEYKGKKIVEVDGNIHVYDPKAETLFMVALDDSKSSGRKEIIKESDNLETAKQYIDWTESAKKENKFVKPIEVKGKDVVVDEGFENYIPNEIKKPIKPSYEEISKAFNIKEFDREDPFWQPTEKKATEVIDWLKESKYTTEYEKELLNKYKNHIEDGLSISFDPSLPVNKGGGVVYNSKGKFVELRINPHNITHPGTTTTVQGTILHELTHFLVKKGERQLYDKVVPLFDLVDKYISENKKELVEQYGNEHLITYGLSGINEFVAESMSNRQFQSILSKINYKGESKSVWQKFTDTIKEYFSKLLGTNDSSVLNEVVKSITQHISENNPLKKEKSLSTKPEIKNEEAKEVTQDTKSTTETVSEQPLVTDIAPETKTGKEGKEPPPAEPTDTVGEGKGDVGGITHAANEVRRMDRKLPEYEKEPQKFEQWNNEAEQKIKDGYDVEKLMDEIQNGKDPNPVENAIRKIYIATLDAEIAKNPTNALLAKQKRFIEIGDLANSRAGRNLVSLKGEGSPLSTISDFYVAKMDALGTDVLTEAQKAEVKKQYQEVQKRNEEAELKIQKLEEENAKLRAEAEIRKAKSTTKRDKKDFVKEREDIKKSILEKWNKAKNVGIAADPSKDLLMDIAPDVAKLMKSYIQEGVVKLEEIVTKIHEELKGYIPNITEKNINDIIAGQYDKPKETKSDLISRLRNIKDKKSEEAVKIKARIKAGDFSEQKKVVSWVDNPEIKKNFPEEYNAALDALKAKEDARHEFDIALLRDQMSRWTLQEKASSLLSKGAGTVKAITTGIDDSAVAIQTYMSLLRRPRTGSVAVYQHFRQGFSQKKFDRWLTALHNSPDFKEMKEMGLDVTEPSSLKEREKEEIFSNRFSGTIKVKGKEYKVLDAPLKPFERAFTTLGNVTRVVGYRTISDKYKRQGYTPEKDPELFKSLATRLNTETGRGAVNEYVDRASKVVTLGIWSPKLMAMKFNILGISDIASLIIPGTKGYYRQLHPKERLAAIRDVAQFATTVAALSYGFALSFGGEIDDDPLSSTFMDVKLPNGKSYNFTGGFSGYIRAIAQFISGKKHKDGKSIKTNRLETAGRFFKGKTPPLTSAALNMASGKDFMGQPTTPLNEAVNLTPISLRGIANQIQNDGASSFFTQGIPTFFGFNVKNEKDYPQKLNEKIKEKFNKQDGTALTDKDLKDFEDAKQELIDKNIETLKEKGIGDTPYKDLTPEEIKEEETYIKGRADDEVKAQMFMEKIPEEKEIEKQVKKDISRGTNYDFTLPKKQQ